MVGSKGGEVQAFRGPGGTTSVWPAKQSTGPVSPRRAQRFFTSPLGMGSIRKPLSTRRSVIRS